MSKSPTGDLTPTEQAAYDIARWRWRADLLDYSAAVLRTVGHEADAALKEAKAVAMRDMADATEQFEKVVAEHGGSSPEGIAAGAQLRQFRASQRTNQAPVVETIDNFTEPTPSELGVI